MGEGYITIGAGTIASLLTALEDSPCGRVRVNLHPGDDAPLHDMFIAIKPGSYIRPHRHSAKSEAFHMVHGACDVVLFDDDGVITDIVHLSADDPGLPFYYRLSEPLYHTVVATSPVVFHEITNGPFVPGRAEHAPWSPDENDALASAAYLAELWDRMMGAWNEEGWVRQEVKPAALLRPSWIDAAAECDAATFDASWHEYWNVFSGAPLSLPVEAEAAHEKTSHDVETVVDHLHHNRTTEGEAERLQEAARKSLRDHSAAKSLPRG